MPSYTKLLVQSYDNEYTNTNQIDDDDDDDDDDDNEITVILRIWLLVLV